MRTAQWLCPALAAVVAAGGRGLAQQAAPRTVTVAQAGPADFTGSDQKPILEAIRALGEAGGVVLIKSGTYLVRSEIRPTTGVTLRGEGEVVLKLPSPVLVTAAAAKGDTSLSVSDTAQYARETTVQICPPEATAAAPGTEEKPTTAKIASVGDGKLVLAGPLTVDVPADSRVGYANHVIGVYSPQRNVTVEGLSIDGGRVDAIPMPGHAERCAIWATGPYSYEKGPSGPPVEGLVVSSCRIRNCYGRAVAMYSVINSEVRGCLIEHIADEAIDFDHFVYHSRAVGNEVRDAVTGVTINDGSYCTVEYNRLTDCGVGVTIWWWHMCPQEDIDVENVIRHNFVYSPKERGISVGRRCFRNQVYGNFVQGGIAVGEADNVVERNVELE
ncbi:MAG: right-handed parallel beta-helix repeat-containing protein [Armatimonadetes bacterium]|nr:right-handed parallel beta-helix repeat-containing protein [Armatimonadota bacterium]